MSTPNELEELRNRRVKLEEESHSLKDKQTNFEERVKVLEEKLAIAELQNNNKMTRDAISQLESKMNELEERLNKTLQAPEPAEPAEKVTPEENVVPEPVEEAAQEVAETEVEKAEEPEEPEEEAVTVKPFEDAFVTEQEDKKRSDKRKRKFF